MNYSEALSYIHSAGRMTVPPGLERVERLCELLGNPQDRLRFVHIVGTNGKGSVAAMLDHILSAAGYRVGVFTSPYLEDFRERIRLQGRMIPEQALADLTTELAPLIDRVVAEGQLRPNEFETVTVLALMYYARTGCDIVVWEAGLGGGVDATNVIGAPEAVVVTSISLDHMAQLGNTPEQIAREKCGVIKPGTGAVISAAQLPQVAAVIRARCDLTGVPLIPGGEPEQIRLSDEGCRFRYRGVEVNLPLLGSYQPGNARCAMDTAFALREKRGWNLPDSTIAVGLATTRWPGRMEVLSRAPLVVIDSGHNRGAIDALCRTLDSVFPHRPVTAVMGMMADKEYEYCLRTVAARCRTVFGVSAGMPRALTAEAVAEVCRDVCPDCRAGGTVEQGIAGALDVLPENGLLLICGSVYVAGLARRHFATEK